MHRSEAVESRKTSTRLLAYLAGQTRPITLADIAREAGVPKQYVWQIARGVRPPSRKVIDACLRLGLPVELIFGSEADTNER